MSCLPSTSSYSKAASAFALGSDALDGDILGAASGSSSDLATSLPTMRSTIEDRFDASNIDTSTKRSCIRTLLVLKVDTSSVCVHSVLRDGVVHSVLRDGVIYWVAIPCKLALRKPQAIAQVGLVVQELQSQAPPANGAA